MYLTRMRINPARRGARKLLSSPHAMHAAVRAAFPNPADHASDQSRTLWRLDANRDHEVALYVVSPGQPDMTHIVEQAGWPTAETWQTRPYRPLLDSLAGGQRWAFRLTANPTRDGRSSSKDEDTKRFGAVTVRQQTEWLSSRVKRWGFVLAAQMDGETNLRISGRETHTFKRRPAEPRVTLVSATYDGVLNVVDADLFRASLTQGIGHGKAYGCGLMTLARVG